MSLVCDNVTLSQDMLRGKSLVIADYPFSPFFAEQPGNPGQYTGIDMDLLVAVAGFLGFDYTLKVPPWRLREVNNVCECRCLNGPRTKHGPRCWREQ